MGSTCFVEPRPFCGLIALLRSSSMQGQLVPFVCRNMYRSVAPVLILVVITTSHHHSFIRVHPLSRLGVCFHARTSPECRRSLHQARALEIRGFPRAPASHSNRPVFEPTRFILSLPYNFNFRLISFSFYCGFVNRKSSFLVCGTHSCCTRHLQSPP